MSDADIRENRRAKSINALKELAVHIAQRQPQAVVSEQLIAFGELTLTVPIAQSGRVGPVS